jgi:proteasome lid subunit RPN8/RPN11
MLSVRVDSAVAEHIRQRAVDCFPREAIGVLGGQPGHVTAAVSLTNRARRPEATLVLRTDLVEADAELTRLGLARIGVFHSHATASAVPSGHDRRTMRPGAIELIVPVTLRGAGPMRAWLLTPDGSTVELPWVS